MSETVDTPGETGVERSPLSGSEESRLKSSFKRAFDDLRYDGNQSVLLDKVWNQYRAELTFAAEVAKAQFDKEFDGVDPKSNRFGVDRIFSGYFGLDSWDNFTDYTQAEVVDWLDDSVQHIGGSGGRDNPLRIGEDVVHLILGVGSYDPSPQTTRVQFVTNDNPGTSVALRPAFTQTDSRIKWLESPKLFNEDTDVYARAFGDEAGSDALYPFGVTYIVGKRKREIDPAQLAVEEVVGQS